jgi:hypothetical protein
MWLPFLARASRVHLDAFFVSVLAVVLAATLVRGIARRYAVAPNAAVAV